LCFCAHCSCFCNGPRSGPSGPSNAGGLLLRELDQRYRIAEKAAACLHDSRDSGKVKHDLLSLVRQRLFAIALGYEDNNDAAWLSKDPALKIMAGKAPASADDLASQPTLSRFENMVTAKDLRRLKSFFENLGQQQRRGRPIAGDLLHY